jgi:Resolvase, N terminal domain
MKSLIPKERLRVSLVYEVDAVVASRWWSEKLKAAIHERVLAHSLCDASSSTGPCGTLFRRPAGFRVSSVPPAVIAQRRRFDVIMAWAIDRLGCSAIDLLGTIQTLEWCGVDLYLDQQSIDTMTPAERLMLPAQRGVG